MYNWKGYSNVMKETILENQFKSSSNNEIGIDKCPTNEL